MGEAAGNVGRGDPWWTGELASSAPGVLTFRGVLRRAAGVEDTRGARVTDEVTKGAGVGVGKEWREVAAGV